MTPERWQHIQSIFNDAVERPASERCAFIEQACGDDTELKATVEAMLAEDSGGTSIVDGGLSEIAGRAIQASQEDPPQEDFGPYLIGGKAIGEGGMGVVYPAEERISGKKVAIKVLSGALLSPARRERFRGEQKLLARLNHPGIAQLYQAGVLGNGTPWFAMEYVEGEPIDKYCRDGKLSINQRMHVFRKVCEAVQYVHGQLIIHRDLKPSNILVNKNGAPKLLDFGIGKALGSPSGLAASAHRTATGLRLMTLLYAAPEQVRGLEPLYPTDVYALGVILYELLAGSPPFDLSKCTTGEAERIIAEKDPVKPSASSRPGWIRASKAEWKDLDALCLKALRKEPERRYQSAEAMARDIDHYLNGEPLEARPDSFGYKTGKFLKRNWLPVLAASFVLMVIAGLVGFFTLRLANERNKALAEAARTRQIQRFTLDLFGEQDRQAAPSKALSMDAILDRGAANVKSLASDPETQAELYLTLGRLYEQLNKFTKAGELLLLALDKTKAVRGESPQTVSALAQLGLLRGDQAQLPEAERRIREALDVASRLHMPPDDPIFVNARLSLGRIMVQKGAYNEAIALLEPIVQHSASGNQDLVNLSEALTALAVAYQYAGHYEAAESTNRRALEVDRKQHGNSHPRVAYDLSNIATANATLGRYVEAESLYRQAHSILETWYGADNPETVQIRSFIGLMASRNGKDAEAEKLLQGVLPLQQQLYPAGHPNLALTYDTLGKLALKRGDLAAAEAALRQALVINRKFYPEGEFRTAVVGGNLADVLVKEGKYAQAEQIVRPSVKALTDHPLPGNMSVGVVQLTLGTALLRQKRYSEAVGPLLGAYDVLKDKPGPYALRLQEVRKALEEVYGALKQPEKAAKFRAELAAVHK